MGKLVLSGVKYRLNPWLAELAWKVLLTQNSGEGDTGAVMTRQEAEYMGNLS